MNEREKLFLDWNDIESACNVLVNELPRSIRAILPVGRGGLVPAAIVAYALDKQIYSRGARGNYAAGQLLVIDDCVDTGETFRKMRDHYHGAIFAAICAKPKGKVYCSHWAIDVPQETWIVYPWALNDVINR